MLSSMLRSTTFSLTFSLLSLAQPQPQRDPLIMPSMTPVDDFLFGMLHQYDKHIHLSGAYDKHARYSQPSLANSILPMFKNRWATGPGQHSEIYQKVIPALQLASRLLTEDYPLTWFTQLTFGERRTDAAGTYIAPTGYSKTPEAIAQVKKNILQIGKVITFMFEPPGYEERAYGSCTPTKSSRDFFHEFRSSDWPSVRRSDDVGHARPCVVLNSAFLHFFRHRYDFASQDEIYRALLILAITLVHEFAHGYNSWLTPEHKEPRWCQKEKEAELGWSWERAIMGYGLDSFRHHGDPKGKYRQLYQIRILEYRTRAERENIFLRFAGTNRTDDRFTRCDATGRKARPAVMDGNEFRHSKTWFENDRKATHFIAAVQTIPMTWVVDWFQEERWTWRKQYWSEQGFYVRPTLGNAFVVLYERDGHKAATLRPLNPAIRVDKEILEQRQRGDHSR